MTASCLSRYLGIASLLLCFDGVKEKITRKYKKCKAESSGISCLVGLYQEWCCEHQNILVDHGMINLVTKLVCLRVAGSSNGLQQVAYNHDLLAKKGSLKEHVEKVDEPEQKSQSRKTHPMGTMT